MPAASIQDNAKSQRNTLAFWAALCKPILYTI